MSERSLELKVGALILVAVGLMAGFIVLLGGFSFERTYGVYVAFENPGGLQEGASVRISGMKVGSIDKIEFRAGMVDEKTGEPEPNVRVRANILEKHRGAIHENARFYVTSQGLLGEPFLAIDPGSHNTPLLAEDAKVHGVSPPRLDLLLSESYELLHQAYEGIMSNEDKLRETFDGLHNTLKGSGEFFNRNDRRLDAIIANLEALTVETRETLGVARDQYVDGDRIKRVLDNLDVTLASVRSDVPVLLKQGRETMSGVSTLTKTFSSKEKIAQFEKLTDDVSATVADARTMTKDAQTLVKHVGEGQGTVGAMVMDEALYDDLQELARDLKHNPWKFFWKE